MINWSSVAALMMALAVGLGAFGAHGLRDRLDAYSMGIYEKAVLYHFVHALGLLIVSVMARVGAVTERAAGRVGWLLFVGMLVFSGSLYLLAVTGVRTLGAITPLGGIAVIAAWLLLAFSISRPGRV